MNQGEHVKQPHLFTRAWMLDVSNHQDLFYRALKNVTPQETAIRVFNLLYPPKAFPAQQGDERDIISYFNPKEEAKTAWDGEDPYAMLRGKADPDDYSNTRKVDILRELMEKKMEIEKQDVEIERLKKECAEQKDKLENYDDPNEVRLLKEDRDKLRSALQKKEIEAQGLLENAMRHKEENKGLETRYTRSQEEVSDLRDQLDALKMRLEKMARLEAEVNTLKAEKQTMEQNLKAEKAANLELKMKL